VQNVQRTLIWSRDNFWGASWRFVVSDDIWDDNSGVVVRSYLLERSTTTDAMGAQIWEATTSIPANVWAELIADALYAKPVTAMPARPKNRPPAPKPPASPGAPGTTVTLPNMTADMPTSVTDATV
jgi:hypothetical protein